MKRPPYRVLHDLGPVPDEEDPDDGGQEHHQEGPVELP